VLSDTPADRADLRPATGAALVDGQQQPTGGDVVVEFDGERVTSPSELQTAVDARRPGDKISITVLREGSRRSIEVTLGVRP
jgi:serine protease Do